MTKLNLAAAACFAAAAATAAECCCSTHAIRKLAIDVRLRIRRLDKQLSVTYCRKSTYILIVSACQLTLSFQIVRCRLRDVVIMSSSYGSSCTETTLLWYFVLFFPNAHIDDDH